jgi:hypothetical protein
MSKAIKCDCCKRSTPDINPKYSRRKKWQWFEFQSDSQGGSEFPLDICEQCWQDIEDRVNKGATQ